MTDLEQFIEHIAPTASTPATAPVVYATAMSAPPLADALAFTAHYSIVLSARVAASDELVYYIQGTPELTLVDALVRPETVRAALDARLNTLTTQLEERGLSVRRGVWKAGH